MNLLLLIAFGAVLVADFVTEISKNKPKMWNIAVRAAMLVSYIKILELTFGY